MEVVGGMKVLTSSTFEAGVAQGYTLVKMYVKISDVTGARAVMTEMRLFSLSPPCTRLSALISTTGFISSVLQLLKPISNSASS